MAVVRTLASPLRHEPPKTKGSRFIASIAPVGSAEEAMAFVEARREEFRDATHNCFAWRMEDRDGFRSSDDGEPSGTAGRPILREIEARGLIGVVAVVTRYFGGTKLGTGGLIRAYGGAAAEALDRAAIVESVVVRRIRLRYGYDLSGSVQGTLASFGLEPESSTYTEDVRSEVAVPVEEVERFVEALGEATAGRIAIE